MIKYLLLLTPFLAFNAAAAEKPVYEITLSNDAFTPAKLIVPAGKAFTLTVKNDTDRPAEFESSRLGREKLIPAHNQILVHISALKAGSYSYENDFHDETTGTIVAQ
jgi:hypothetical protein